MRFKTVYRLDLAVGGDHAGNFLAHNFFRAHGRSRVPPVDSGEEQHRRHHKHQHNRHATAAPVISALSCHALTELLPTESFGPRCDQCLPVQRATAFTPTIKNHWHEPMAQTSKYIQARAPAQKSGRLACGPAPSASPLANFSAGISILDDRPGLAVTQ